MQRPPNFYAGNVFEKAPFDECHASTIAEARKGEFLVAFFAGTKEGNKDVAIWLSRGDGASWEPPEKIAWDEEAPCWNPVLFKDSEGKVHLFYKVGFSPESWSGTHMFSRNDGIDWSEPLRMPAGLVGPAKNKPITMSNGEVICGSSVESYKAWACWVEIFRWQKWEDWRSWKKFGPIYYEGVMEGVIQPSIIELEKGRLRAFMRSTKTIGRICVADSSDYGRTWSGATATSLPNPDSGIDAVKLRSGSVAIAYNDSTDARTPLSLSASKDGGETWRKVLDLEAELAEFSYPSIIESSDGSVHVVYTWKRKRIKHAGLDSNLVDGSF
ncbi:MAG: sialidase family protein [Thermoproteota archaeon]